MVSRKVAVGSRGSENNDRHRIHEFFANSRRFVIPRLVVQVCFFGARAAKFTRMRQYFNSAILLRVVQNQWVTHKIALLGAKQGQTPRLRVCMPLLTEPADKGS
jgi:hypothetical protein